jgi:hypothetical protein
VMKGSNHEFSIYRLEHKIEEFVLISDPDLFVVKGNRKYFGLHFFVGVRQES